MEAPFAFADAIACLTDYISDPDMGTDETCMAWVHDEIGRAVGLPPEIGGIPLDEIDATGYGLAHAAEIAAPHAGIDIEALAAIKAAGGDVRDYDGGTVADRDAIVEVACDIWIPAARPDMLVVPDFIANAGGAICGAVEYAGGTRAAALAVIEEKLRENTGAVAMARRRVEAAMGYRRWS